MSTCAARAAPLQLSGDGRCGRCGAGVAPGEHDWIVSAITKDTFAGIAPDAFVGVRRVAAATGLSQIAQSDPQFSADAFVKRCATAFEALESAWQARDLAGVRGFMSPGLYYAWQTQIERMREDRRKNVLDRIDATCADYEVDEETGHVVFGDRTPRPFCEHCTFQRGTGVKTGARPGTFESHCPHCRARLVLNTIGECAYCKAAVTSGRFDWVLSRIE